MQYQVEIRGLPPGMIHHNGAAGMDPRSEANIEKAQIARTRASNRTESDDERLAELECQTALWLDDRGFVTVPAASIRSMIETAARKLKQGPQVREGLMIVGRQTFKYDVKALGRTVEELGKNAQFTTGVVVQRNRVMRTRARFPAWSLVFIVDAEEELVDIDQLGTWLDIGGRRIGLGDWRPEKSGEHGRFEVVSVESMAVDTA